MTRDINRVVLNSRETLKKFKKGKPTLNEIPDGGFELRYIDGYGLRLVARYGKDLYYLTFTKGLST